LAHCCAFTDNGYIHAQNCILEKDKIMAEPDLKDYQFIYHDDQTKTREDVKRLLGEGFKIFGTAIVMKKKQAQVDTEKRPKIFMINKPIKKENENGNT
jgi:hypothetical protein